MSQATLTVWEYLELWGKEPAEPYNELWVADHDWRIAHSASKLLLKDGREPLPVQVRVRRKPGQRLDEATRLDILTSSASISELMRKHGVASNTICALRRYGNNPRC